MILRVKRKLEDVPSESVWVTHRQADGKESVGVNDGPLQKKKLFRLLETVPIETGKVNRGKRLTGVDRLQMLEGKNKRHHLLNLAINSQKTISKSARYQQVKKTREFIRRSPDSSESLLHLYDVVRLDDDDVERSRKSEREQAKRNAMEQERKLLCNFLPLVREHVPNVADDFEQSLELDSDEDEKEDVYVYDVYHAAGEGLEPLDPAVHQDFPTIEVFEEGNFDWRVGRSDSDYDSEDSNDENNSDNDYPDEEEGEEETSDEDEYDLIESKMSRFTFDEDEDD